MTDRPISAFVGALAELAVAGVAGHIAQTLALLPGWAGGILGGLLLMAVQRMIGPTLDVYGHRIKARVTGKHARVTPTPAPPAPKLDDTDASG